MKKPRLPKVGVKHYLHKKAKPIIKGNKKLYPIYVRITFLKKSTKLKSRWRVFLDDFSNVMIKDDGFDLWTDEDFLSLEENEGNKYALESEINAIKSLVHFFYKEMKTNLVSIGVPILYDQCLRPIREIISDNLNNSLRGEIGVYSEDKISDIIYWEHSSFLDVYEGLSLFSRDKKISTSFYKSILSNYLTDYNSLKKIASNKTRYFEWLLISMERYRVPLKFYEILDRHLLEALNCYEIHQVALALADKYLKAQRHESHLEAR